MEKEGGRGGRRKEEGRGKGGGKGGGDVLVFVEL